MASKRESLILAVIAALEAAGGPTGLSVHRFPTRDLESDDLPAIAVFPTDDVPGQATHDGKRDKSLTLAIELRAQATSGESPDEALDPLYVWTVQALFTDPTLGGLASALWEGKTVWEGDERSAAYGAAVTLFEIEYETTEADPET